MPYGTQTSMYTGCVKLAGTRGMPSEGTSSSGSGYHPGKHAWPMPPLHVYGVGGDPTLEHPWEREDRSGSESDPELGPELGGC